MNQRHLEVTTGYGKQEIAFGSQARVTTLSKEGGIYAEFLVEIDDKGTPTVHLTVNPGCHVGQILIDGKHNRVTSVDPEGFDLD